MDPMDLNKFKNICQQLSNEKPISKPQHHAVSSFERIFDIKFTGVTMEDAKAFISEYSDEFKKIKNFRQKYSTMVTACNNRAALAMVGFDDPGMQKLDCYTRWGHLPNCDFDLEEPNVDEFYLGCRPDWDFN